MFIIITVILCIALMFGIDSNSESAVLSLEEIKQRQGNLSKKEVEQILKKAKDGFADYQLFAGVIYASGTAVESDMNKAVEWWEKSAEGGNILAQRYLGVEYATGEHIPQNYEKAFEWYKKAASNGDLISVCNLGLMYELGQYVPRDFKKAVEYYQKAADKDLPAAQILLGDMYFYNHGVDLDRKKACELYKKALNAKDISSVNPDQVAEVYALLGRAYVEKFADCGNITKTEAISYLKKAFGLGNYESIRCLALIEEELDQSEVEWLYQTASKYPNAKSCLFALGICYEFGKGTAQNFKLAFECYQKSADKGDPWGMHYLAYAYFAGQGTEKNLEEGFNWELRAAEFIPQAQFNVGISYLKGDGVNQNIEESIRWLKRASENFYSAADEVLEEINKNHK